jgi:hypothetical protein
MVVESHNDLREVEEILMKAQIIAGLTALALATVMTTGATAFDGGTTSHADRSHGGFNSSRFAGVRGFESWRHGGSRRFDGSYGGRSYGDPRGGYTDLGPLGLRFGPATGYGPGTSVSAWSY